MNDNKVITVTINPSLDRTVTVHYLGLGYHNRTAETTLLEPAGAGVNVSRALHSLGGKTEAVVALGMDANGKAYEALLRAEDFPVHIVQRPGSTRSNIILLDTGNKQETQIIEESQCVINLIDHLGDVLRDNINAGDYVIAGGSLPGDASNDVYEQLLGIAREAGAVVMLDTFGEPLNAGLRSEPDMVALFQNELEAQFNHPVRALDDVVRGAQRLLDQGVLRVLVTVQGEIDGALLVSDAGSWVAAYPLDIADEGTSVGIKDALVAGYLLRCLQDADPAAALHLGAAAALYAMTQVGSVFGSLDEVEANLDRIVVEAIEG